jgi:hypothetical protein
MTSDPLDTGSLDARRTALGLLNSLSFFKFLASIIVLSKMRRCWRYAMRWCLTACRAALETPFQPRNCKPEAMRESQSVLARH